MKFKTTAGSLLNKINLVSNRIFNHILRSNGINDINTGQGSVLFSLLKQDNVPIQELCKRTLLKKSTMTTVIDRLEKSQYIRRTPSKDDGRIINISLTEKNNELSDAYKKISEEMTDIFFKGFSQEEISTLEISLNIILNNLVEYESTK